MYQMLAFLLVLFMSPQVFSEGDTNWLKPENKYYCAKELETCFLDDFSSEDDAAVVDGIFLYLDNIDYLSNYYSKEKFLNELAVISKKNKNFAFLIEASIYFNGGVVEQNVDKAIEIIESSPFYNESDPNQMIILGRSCYLKFTMSKKPPVDWSLKAKEYLKKSYELDKAYVTRELSYILARSTDMKELELAGEVFKFFAETGDEGDVYNYEVYLKGMRKIKENR
ncbi:hypothetical protein [Vibrio aestuarianus]|uniref:hypothetical protein n=2 Tax=Vibrio aestuarianus TaxID=28171 RepID=UPI0015932908|nr:hypothetical protein [Vibrio aestuarianus]MDE1264052.1 hypothetical protein [Vibrio aestuarianus]MDE1296179.1 hypothetical protein [Vibrio aestuarianus]MDE1310021.1 hypothetical protein [Vibrio aestuarianus]NGZ91214.1 hypothetical protein [Vibrio aestuarianus subsp. cardii]